MHHFTRVNISFFVQHSSPKKLPRLKQLAVQPNRQQVKKFCEAPLRGCPWGPLWDAPKRWAPLLITMGSQFIIFIVLLGPHRLKEVAGDPLNQSIITQGKSLFRTSRSKYFTVVLFYLYYGGLAYKWPDCERKTSH